MASFFNEQDYENLAGGFKPGTAQSGQAGFGYAKPIRQAQIGKMDALQKLALMRIGQGGARRQLATGIEDELTQLEQQQNEPDILDLLGLGGGIFGAVRGYESRQNARKKYGL